MIFGAVQLAGAEGAILAHGVARASLSKGILLGAGHIATLRACGIEQIMVARLESGDMDENAAATALAMALIPDAGAQGVRLTPADAGRINVMSMRAGLLQVDAAQISAVNHIDPMITLATRANLTRAVAGTLLATIKVISFGVAGDLVARACKALDAGSVGAPFALSVLDAQLTTATLIETHHAGQRPKPNGRRVLDERLDRLGSTLSEVVDVPHDEVALARAITQAQGEIVFILTASSSCDVNDTAPAALRRAGGHVVRVGLPVDPGTLMFLGCDATGRPVIGLPGSARSPALNGVDPVLERIICGVPIDPQDICTMGVGGLLCDGFQRGQMR